LAHGSTLARTKLAAALGIDLVDLLMEPAKNEEMQAGNAELQKSRTRITCSAGKFPRDRLRTFFDEKFRERKRVFVRNVQLSGSSPLP
jgi:hypothetical protein